VPASEGAYERDVSDGRTSDSGSKRSRSTVGPSDVLAAANEVSAAVARLVRLTTGGGSFPAARPTVVAAAMELAQVAASIGGDTR
jgi:hypothetical protein